MAHGLIINRQPAELIADSGAKANFCKEAGHVAA